MFEAKRQPTLSEQAYNQIKDAICQGSVAPGDILSENQIAQQLGMSRTPVREALRALASEGFVEIRNGIGAYVKPLSSKDMEDLYEVRCLLEMQAIKTSIYRISNDEIDDLTRRFQAIYDACEQGDSPAQGEFSELDWELHSLLVDRCTIIILRRLSRAIIPICAAISRSLSTFSAMSTKAHASTLRSCACCAPATSTSWRKYFTPI